MCRPRNPVPDYGDRIEQEDHASAARRPERSGRHKALDDGVNCKVPVRVVRDSGALWMHML